MASTTTLYRTADWTNAESAHGPTLATWLRDILPHSEDPQDHDGLAQRYGDSFARWVRRLEEGRDGGGDFFTDFWTADRWLTHVNLHPGMAPFGTWSLEKARTRTVNRAA